MVVVDENDAVVSLTDIDPNINDRDEGDDHDSDGDLMMVVLDLGGFLGNEQSIILKVELEGSL